MNWNWNWNWKESQRHLRKQCSEILLC